MRNPSNSNPAQVKVVLSNNFDRNSVFKNAKKLASPKVPQNLVYIAPDLSKEEREENEKLRAELQTKRNASLTAGENCKWIIKEKKIIKIPSNGLSTPQGNSQVASST